MNRDTEELKISVRRYRDLDNQIREINKNVNTLRERRKIIELEIADFLKSPQFSQHNIIALEDGSRIKVQRPEQWSKSWSLSKGDLSEYLESYFQSTNNPNADDCFKFIVKQQKQESVANEFKLTRIVADENVDNE